MSDELVRDFGEGAWSPPLRYGIVALESDIDPEELIAHAKMAEYKLQL